MTKDPIDALTAVDGIGHTAQILLKEVTDLEELCDICVTPQTAALLCDTVGPTGSGQQKLDRSPTAISVTDVDDASQ